MQVFKGLSTTQALDRWRACMEFYRRWKSAESLPLPRLKDFLGDRVLSPDHIDDPMDGKARKKYRRTTVRYEPKSEQRLAEEEPPKWGLFPNRNRSFSEHEKSKPSEPNEAIAPTASTAAETLVDLFQQDLTAEFHRIMKMMWVSGAYCATMSPVIKKKLVHSRVRWTVPLFMDKYPW